MHIYLGADHRGLELKKNIHNWLDSQLIPYTDFGPDHYDAEDDYNDAAKAVAKALLQNLQSEDGSQNFGILVCGSAQGMAMQANRYKGIRAAICHTALEAIETRTHNDANVLCLSADSDFANFDDIVDAFFSHQALSDSKYKRRNQKLDED